MRFLLVQFLLTQGLAYVHVSGGFFVLVESLEQSHLREFCVIQTIMLHSCAKVQSCESTLVAKARHFFLTPLCHQ